VNWRKSRRRASAEGETSFAVNPFDSRQPYLDRDGLDDTRGPEKASSPAPGRNRPLRATPSAPRATRDERMPRSLRRFLADDRGATVIEYATIGAFVSILIYTATKLIGTKISSAYLLPVVNNLT
jgi:pilus assembly protein Flp/PilA